MTDVSESTRTDPVTLSVLLNRLHSIAEEMTLTLEHTAWTSILALARDFSCALYDADSRQVAVYDALPIHTTSQHIVLAEIARTFEGQIEPGDVFACNDPYRGNTHVGDLTTACPVFVGGRHVFWAVTKGHQLDVGAFVPTSVTGASRNVWQEGLTIPPVKLVAGGVAREDVIDLYLSNMRYREMLRGDLLAQIGSIEVGRMRLVELCEEQGVDEVLRYVEAILDYADRRMGDEIAAMPDGVYRGRGWIDSDGIDRVDVPIEVAVTVAGDRVHVDYSGSGEQAVGGANGSYATTQAAGCIPFLYYVADDIPRNQGCIGHIEVYAPEGTICNAVYPASTSTATVVPSDMMQEAINCAMVSAIPDLVAGGGARDSNVAQFSGEREGTREMWAAMLFNSGGGGGAAKDCDGWPLILAQAALGGAKALSIEQVELLYPLRVERMEVEVDSMGAGRWIGGPGVRFEVGGTEGEMDAITFGDGCRNPPHGVVGGTPGIGGGAWVEPRDGGPRRYVSAAGNVRVGREESWMSVSTGGGGYGLAVEREVESVRRDVRDGFVSRESARELFGVVVSDDLDPEVDEPATERLRAALRERERPLVDPDRAGAATWLDTVMRPDDQYLLNPS